MGLKKITLPLTCSQCSANNCSKLEGRTLQILSMDHACQLTSIDSGIHSSRGTKSYCVPHCLISAMTVLGEKEFPDSSSICHVSTMSLHSSGLCVFSVWVGSGGLLGKPETDLLLKQNNKSEQISLVIIGCGKTHILFSFIFLQDCSRGGASTCQVMWRAEENRKSWNAWRNQRFSCIFQISFPCSLRQSVLLPHFSYKERKARASFTWPTLRGWQGSCEFWHWPRTLCDLRQVISPLYSNWAALQNGNSSRNSFLMLT